jgi:uncharacterized protein HemX
VTTTKTNIALAAVAIVVAILLGTTLWSDHKLAKLEHELEEAKRNAEAAEQRSRELENAAAEYKQKLEYLEGSLSDIERIASKQDEEIKLLETDTDNSRRGAARARSVRRVESTAAELCRKLADLGHPCE